MEYIADLVILAILIFFVLRGYKRGLVRTLFGLFTVIVALALAATFGKSAGELIRKTEIYENMHIKVEKSIEEYAQEKTEALLLESFFDNKNKSAIPKALSKFGVELDGLFANKSQTAQSEPENEQTDIQEAQDKSIAQKTADLLMRAFSNAIGFVAVFLVSLIALKLLRIILDALAHLPLINSVNKLGGLLAGLVLGGCVVFVLTAICEFLLPYLPDNPVLYPGIHNKTILYSFFVSVNPIFLILFG